MNPLRDLHELESLFPTDIPLYKTAEHVPASQVPEPYQSLLVHDHHMTVTMEEFHHCQVEVRVLEHHLDGDIYSRKIILLKEGTENVVQFGIVKFDLQYVTSIVKEELLSQKIPLGRVLIRHNVLRHIDLGAIIRFDLGPGLMDIFHVDQPLQTYGRLATIFCNNKPAVDLLEISVPLTK